MKGTVQPRFAKMVEQVAPDGTDPWVLHWEARQAEAAGQDVIVLSVGDPDLDTPPSVVDTAVRTMRAGDTHYTETAGRPALRAAIAARHAARSGQPVTADNVIVLGGTQNSLFVASLCVAGAGDEIIALDPMYATYPATIRASGAKLIPVPTPAARGFHTDLAAIEAAVSPRTRAIFLATPNNPSGVVLGEEEVEGLAEIARRRGLWLVSDEVYAGLADAGRVPSLGSRLPDQVLTVASLSKTHAMTGWRCGWLVGPADFVGHAHDLAQCMLYGLPGFVQEAAVTALAIAEQSEASMREYCNRRCEILYTGLKDVPGIRAYLPQAGMFMLIDVRGTGLNGSDFVPKLYRAEGVSVLDGSVFGQETRGFVRASFAVEERLLHEAALRIRRFCASLKAGA
jgi:aspartate/methionine/tyrosine aminotransferase